MAKCKGARFSWFTVYFFRWNREITIVLTTITAIPVGNAVNWLDTTVLTE